MLNFLETPADIQRFLEIMRVFLRYGWEGSSEVAQMKERFPFLSRLEGISREEEKLTGPVKLRKIFEELGPTFIKFGQMLSTRPDLIKEEYVVELRKLQDEVPPFDFVEARHIIQQQLGKPLEKIFRQFDEKPVAAASIGQVHYAELLNGKKVAVKVQRPDIEHIIQEDLRIIQFIAGLVEKSIKETKYYNPVSIAQDFAETMVKELDYNREAKNAEIFRKNFQHEEGIIVPAVLWEHTTGKVLTLERVPGEKISNFYSNKNAELKKKLAELYIDCFFKQMLVYGFFQADPHPANIFAAVQKGKPVISLLDFGMVGRVDYELKDNFATTIVLIFDKNAKGLMRQLKALGMIDRIEDEQTFLNDIAEIIDYFYDFDLNRIDFNGFGNAFIRALVKNKVRVPRQYLLLIRSLMIAQDSVQKLYPNINIIEIAKPYIGKIMEEKANPAYLLRSFRENYFEMSRFLKELPESIMHIVKKMEEEDFKVSLEAKTLDGLSSSLSRSSSTLSTSIILAAVIMASTALLTAKIDTVIGNTADLGAIGFVAAMAIALFVVLKLLRI